MTSTSGPTWYDVLGVSSDATPEEIRTAWRAATDKFEPGSGSGQFRMFNEAAEVLLDPTRRAAYDEALVAATAPAATSPVPITPAALSSEPAVSPPPPALDEEPTATAVEPPEAKASKTARFRRPGRTQRPASRGAVVATAVLAVLAVGAVVLAALFAVHVRRDAQTADARDEAPASAERAAKALLSYDYRELPADRQRASTYLTDSFKKKYLQNFSLLEKQKDGSAGAAVQTKTVVTSTVLGSGVMDAEPDRARVLVYVDQTSKKPGVDPQVFQNRVAMTMVKSGGKWLVDDVKSY